MARGQARDRPGGQKAGIAERLVHRAPEALERLLALGAAHGQLEVLRADRLRHLARVLRLVVAAHRHAQAESWEALPERERRERRHQPRIHPAREEHPERDLLGQARAHRALERFEAPGRRLAHRARGAAECVPRPPVAGQVLFAMLEHQGMRGRDLADRGERAVGSREVAVHEIARQRVRRRIARHPRQRRQRARLRSECHRARRDRDEQRLLTGPVARERQAARAGVPDRDRKHAIEAFRELGRILLVQTRQHRGVGAFLDDRAAPHQLAAQRLVVVDLAVHHRVHRAVGAGGDPGRRERRDDREPAEPERHSRIPPQRAAARAAVLERTQHLGHPVRALFGAHAGGPQPRDSTHVRAA